MGPVEDHSLVDFTRTRWSMVRGLQGAHADARGALTELAVRYWYPVYAYVRRCGHPQEIAQDIKETVFGNRMDLGAICIGGVRYDLDERFAQ